ncbi:helix-turn-helix-type transcriptional regulator [Lewinellaceae bacterium SD302]|nr:helix-turn-helix-type transcriptional regulator [Lewinellaceae bacterium SD302]
MAIYSISDLAKLSGVKAHTIRAWEQRHGIIIPKRTKSNIRYYEDADLKELLNVALLNKNGFRISKIADMSEEEKAMHIAEVSSVNYEYDTQLDALTISMIELDEFKFNHIIDTNIQQQGFERTMLEVIYPFLDKLAALWFTGSVNTLQERFVSNLIRAKLIGATDRLERQTRDTHPTYLLFLPQGEQQELSLLFLHYLLRARGLQSIYMGNDISLADLKGNNKVLQPDFVFTIISETFVGQPVNNYLDRLSEIFSTATLLVSGYQIAAQGIQRKERLVPLNGLKETLDFIEANRNVSEKGHRFNEPPG